MPFVFAHRYRCDHLLGTGGYGDVWAAYDEHLGREVALKLFHRGDPLSFALKEAHAMTGLESPYILRVFNADRYQDVPFIATAVAPGGSAKDRMGQLGISPDLAIRWTRHMLVGLTVCHTRNVVHRDLKPSNIFLRDDDHAQLGDFGVAATMDTLGRTRPEGTFANRAPETWTHGFATVRSDIYSAGLSLYILLTGVSPFEGATEAEIRAAVVGRTHTRLRELAPHASQTLQMRVEKAMAANPDDRYQTAMEFHDALGKVRPLPRLWIRISPHAGHDRCWRAKSLSAGGHDLNVCIQRTGVGFEVETRRTGGARILAGCRPVSGEAALGIFLRRLFESV